jgi:DnaJ homolog subfamily B member 12
MGGPGIRIHQFGGGGPRRRPTAATGADGRPQEAASTNLLASILPILLFFIIPLLTSFLSGIGGGTPGPTFAFEKTPSASLTQKWTSSKYKVDYWVNPSEVRDFSRGQRRDLDHKAEVRMVTDLNHQCSMERSRQQELFENAQGWFSVDREKVEEARNMKMDGCDKLKDLERRATSR